MDHGNSSHEQLLAQVCRGVHGLWGRNAAPIHCLGTIHVLAQLSHVFRKTMFLLRVEPSKLEPESALA
jgi:hypothetical protein